MSNSPFSPGASVGEGTPAPPIVTRFAPSPTGYLHLGHAFAAILAERAARAAGGRFLLRLEDIDQARCRPDYADAILEDLAWLGLTWHGPVRRQSEHFTDYAVALAALEARGLLYPCFCTRAEIAAEIAAIGGAPHESAGARYPGTCRSLAPAEREKRRESGAAFALRLDLEAALATIDRPLHFIEEGAGPGGETGDIAATPELFGDVVLARKDTPASYHLCATFDDARDGVTLVTRGRDLFEATHLHVLLQRLFGWPTPRYRHHRIIVDEAGERLSKRHKALTLRALREAGESAASVRARLPNV